MWNQVINTPNAPTLLQWQGLHILSGLNAVTGDEGSGKTRLLQALGQAHDHALWLDLRLPADDQSTPTEVWARLQSQQPHWSALLQAELCDALQLQEHLHKRLFMLSAGSRRKVALLGLLASGAALTCIDQPYVALDLASAQVVREFLQDMADHPSRAWVVADYEADPELPWNSTLSPSV
jgi:ABC-type lipoprotein export system ATPase subunit